MSLAGIRTALRAAVAAVTTTSLVLTAYPQPGTAQALDPVEEGRSLGQQLTVDPKTLFKLEDGTVTLEGGDEIPLEELFPGEHRGDATTLEDSYGDEAATVDQGHAAQQRLADEPGGTGEAYRTLMASPYDGPRDLSTEPWFDNTRTILSDIDRLGGEFGRCVPTQVIGTSPRTVHQPDLRICTRPANEPSTGACRLEHSASLSESQTHARVGVYGAITNTFELDFAAGSWRQIAPAATRAVVSRAEAREILRLPQDRPVVLAVRRLAHRMGLQDLVAAFATVLRRIPDAVVLQIHADNFQHVLDVLLHHMDLGVGGFIEALPVGRSVNPQIDKYLHYFGTELCIYVSHYLPLPS